MTHATLTTLSASIWSHGLTNEASTINGATVSFDSWSDKSSTRPPKDALTTLATARLRSSSASSPSPHRPRPDSLASFDTTCRHTASPFAYLPRSASSTDLASERAAGHPSKTREFSPEMSALPIILSESDWPRTASSAAAARRATAPRSYVSSAGPNESPTTAFRAFHIFPDDLYLDLDWLARWSISLSRLDIADWAADTSSSCGDDDDASAHLTRFVSCSESASTPVSSPPASPAGGIMEFAPLRRAFSSPTEPRSNESESSAVCV
mmetsp:Transcript_30850/g.73504  ORF Transcript_30850/g.73504 Transcript_30850/m.73504 type:complete len:268 (-) Transcript_30850:358-1161(-)